MSHPVTLTELFEHIRHYEPKIYIQYEQWFNEATVRYQLEPSVPMSELEKKRYELYCFGDSLLASEYPDGMWETGFRYCLKKALAMFDELIAKASAQEKP